MDQAMYENHAPEPNVSLHNCGYTKRKNHGTGLVAIICSPPKLVIILHEMSQPKRAVCNAACSDSLSAGLLKMIEIDQGATHITGCHHHYHFTT